MPVPASQRLSPEPLRAARSGLPLPSHPSPAEIKLHVKGALNNGLTADEIKEILLHATVYCGIPAGLDAFKAAHEVLESEGALD
jgi:alkylhydroperoxidase/carboxymuconolactone decarboxylase family protein YurZ